MTPNEIRQEFDELDEELEHREHSLSEEEVGNIEYGMWLMAPLMEAIDARVNEPEWFFFAPPTNFSYKVN